LGGGLPPGPQQVVHITRSPAAPMFERTNHREDPESVEAFPRYLKESVHD